MLHKERFKTLYMKKASKHSPELVIACYTKKAPKHFLKKAPKHSPTQNTDYQLTKPKATLPNSCRCNILPCGAGAERGSQVALDMVPRVTLAQKLDSMTTMGKITGHRAVIEALHLLERFTVGEITASGKFPPAKVLVIGAGVAGLAAIGRC